MPLPTNEQKQEYYAQRYGEYAPYRPELSNFTTAYRSPEPQYGFMEQVYKNFQTENIVGAALYYMNDPRLGEMPFVPQAGFNPGKYIGRYEPYIEQYPELAESRSMAEFNYIASRIDRDLQDREIVQQGGFWRGLATGAPAGILDPINLVPFASAAKGISIASKALARKQIADALSRGVVSGAILKRGIRPGVEGAVAQYPVEMILSAYQPMRTEDERYQNIMGAAVFSSVLGVSGGVIGAAKKKSMIALIGAESTNAAMQQSGARLFGPGGVFGPPAAREAQTGVQRVRSKNSNFAAYIDAMNEVDRRRENYLASVRAQERAGERLPLYQRGLQEIVQPDERRSPISAMRSAAGAISRVASRRAVRAADLTERLRKAFSLTRAAPSDRPGLARDFYDQVEGRTQLRRDEGRVSGGVDRAYNIDTGVAERLMELADDPDAGLSLRVREDGFVEATWFENGVGKAETIPYEIDYVDRQDPMTTRWPENSVDLVDMAQSMSQRTLDHVGPRPMETPAQYFGRIYRGGYGSGAVRLSKEDAAYLRMVEANPEQVAGEGMELIVRVEGDKIVVYKREKTGAAQAKPRDKKARGKRAKEQQRAETAAAAAIGEPTKAPVEVAVRTIQMKEPVNVSVDFMERALAEDGRPQAEVTDAPFATDLEADSKGVMLDPDAYVVRISRDKGKPTIWSTQEIAESGAVPVEDALRDPKVRNAVEEIEHLDSWRSAPESVAKAEEAKAKISSARDDARPARAKIKSEREVVKQATDKAKAADKAYREELKYAEIEFGKEAQELAESYAKNGGAWPRPTPQNGTRNVRFRMFVEQETAIRESESDARRRAMGWLTPAEEQAIVLHDLREQARLAKEELEIAKDELAATKGEFASVLQEAADVRDVNRGDIAQQQQFDFVDVSAKSGFLSRRKEGMDLHTNLRMLAKDLYTGMRSVGADWERSYRVTAGGAIVNKATIYKTRGTARGHGGKKYGYKYQQLVDHFDRKATDSAGRKLDSLLAPYRVYRIAGGVDPNIDGVIHQPRGSDRWYVITDADINPARATEHANRMGYDRPFTVGQSTGGWRSLDSQPSFGSKKAAEAFVRQRYREWVQTTAREAWEDNRRSVYQKSIDKVQLEVEHTRDAFARRQELQNIVDEAKGKYIRRDTEELLAPEVKAMQPAPGFRAIVPRVGPTIKDLRCP